MASNAYTPACHAPTSGVKTPSAPPNHAANPNDTCSTTYAGMVRPRTFFHLPATHHHAPQGVYHARPSPTEDDAPGSSVSHAHHNAPATVRGGVEYGRARHVTAVVCYRYGQQVARYIGHGENNGMLMACNG